MSQKRVKTTVRDFLPQFQNGWPQDLTLYAKKVRGEYDFDLDCEAILAAKHPGSSFHEMCLPEEGPDILKYGVVSPPDSLETTIAELLHHNAWVIFREQLVRLYGWEKEFGYKS